MALSAESTGGIHDIIKGSTIVYPDKEKQASTEMGSSKAFEELLRASQEDPASFWDNVAKELHWFKPWEETISGSLPDFEFFKGGVSNPICALSPLTIFGPQQTKKYHNVEVIPHFPYPLPTTHQTMTHPRFPDS